MMNNILETQILKKILKVTPAECYNNPSHDLSHSLRVAKNSIEISDKEGGDLEVLIATSLLHDIANLPKNHPKNKDSAKRSAQKAILILNKISFPKIKIPIVIDSILCHSFSSGLIPTTLEGKIFQDADRLDAIGAIGIARTFAVSASFNTQIYSIQDPFAKSRLPNDKKYTLDHFFIKLLKIPSKMLTKKGKQLAKNRIKIMQHFLENLKIEI